MVSHDSMQPKPIKRIKQLELSLEGQKKAYSEGISNAKDLLRGSEATEGLSINHQVRIKSGVKRYSRMVAKVNGKPFYCDPEKMRVSKLKTKCENHFKIIENYEIEGTPYSSCPLDKSERFKHQFYTLTYDPKKGDWSNTDISMFFDRLRRYIENKVKTPVCDPWLYLGYFWVREFHKDGRVHYHFILSSPKSWNLPDIHLDKKKIWTKGMTTCGMRDKKPIRSYGYLIKYLTKDQSKSSVASKYMSQRSYGSSYIKKLVGFDSTYLSDYTRLFNLPKWLRGKLYSGAVGVPGVDSMSFTGIKKHYDITKVSGGYIINRIFFESPYTFETLIGEEDYMKLDKPTKEEIIDLHLEVKKSIYSEMKWWE